jgi:alpha-1,6-mannosyltransferase
VNRTGINRWSELRPWHTNAALVVIGCAMVYFTRQLTIEYFKYEIGYSGTSSAHLVLYLAAVAIFLIKPTNTDRYTFPIILTVAVLCRLVALFCDPVLSSDVYRYAWDGVVQHAHINPYRYVPGNADLAFLREPNQDLFDNMNRRDYAHTIYPPVAQMLFYAITYISPSVLFMKAAMVLFEGLTMTGLMLLLRHLGRSREWSLLYAWCPLLVWEIAGSGHVDSIVIAFMVLALLFRYQRQPILTGVPMGSSTGRCLPPLQRSPSVMFHT